MLSREIATTLGECFWNASVYSYSFLEYLKAKGMFLSKNWMYGKQSAEVNKLFNTYFTYGGFPELTGVVPLKQMCIITRDEERTISHNSGAVIKVVPIWEWLLIDYAE